MHILRRFLVVGSLAAMAVLGGAVNAQAAIPSERLEAVDAYLPSILEEFGVPGVALVIVDDGQVVREVTLGTADAEGRAVTPQTPFMLASVSKAFTALAVMQLVEAGELDLDAPVQRFLPWFRVADEGASADITLRHLLHHTSGLSTETGRQAHEGDAQDADALERSVRALATAELVAPPGERHEYSNANYDALGMVVQAVSGSPYSEYLETNVFEPLDMRHSHGTVEAAREDGLSEGFYPWWGNDWRPIRVPLPRAAGPSATTFVSIEDMGHALMAHLAGGSYEGRSVLSPAGIAAMQTPAVTVDQVHAYGMGWGVRPYWELMDVTEPTGGDYAIPSLVEHGGEWANARTYAGLVPSEAWGFAVFLNGNDGVSSERLSAVPSSLLSILAGGQVVSTPGSDDVLRRDGRALAVLLLVLEVVSLVWSLWWLTTRARRPSGAPRRVVTLVTPLALDLFVLWLAFVYVPDTYGSLFGRAFVDIPDLGLVAIVTVAIAAVWGTLRTILILIAWRRFRSSTTPDPAMATQ